MDDPNNFELNPQPDHKYHSRKFLYGIAVMFIIVYALVVINLLSSQNIPKSSNQQAKVTKNPSFSVTPTSIPAVNSQRTGITSSLTIADLPLLFTGVTWSAPQASTINVVSLQGQVTQQPAIIIYSNPVQKIPIEMLTYYKQELEKRGWVYSPDRTTEGGYSSGNGEDCWTKNGRFFYVGSKYGQLVSIRYSK